MSETRYTAVQAAAMLGVKYTKFDWASVKTGIVGEMRGRVRWYTREELDAIREAMAAAEPPAGWLTTHQVAAECGTRPDYISALAKQGEIEAQVYLAKWYFPPDTVEKVRAIRQGRHRWSVAGQASAVVALEGEDPLDVPTVADWRAYGYEVRRREASRCRHPLVEVGTGVFTALLCGRCNVVYVSGQEVGA